MCGGHSHKGYSYHYHTQVHQSKTNNGVAAGGIEDVTYQFTTPGPFKCFKGEIFNVQAMQFVIEPAFKHIQDDTAFVFVQSMDKNSAEFYDNIDKQKLSQFNPFVEPVFLKTKIEGCIGVFGSAVVSDSVLFIYPE